jgi:hypothetical protein
MSPFSSRCLLFLTGLFVAVASSVSAAESNATNDIKRITDRYALTRTRINALLGLRLNPTPLPANPPNPFYQTPKELLGPIETPGITPETAQVPEGADLSDEDTLRKYALAFKLGGVVTRNGVPYLIVNGTPCKTGDVITAGPKDRTVYLRILNLTPQELMLGLNDSTFVLPLRK